MAADAERAQRIRDLKDSRPDLKWRMIADAVGVTERSVHGWRKTGALGYENAKRLASVFEVDLDWLWRGPHETPDLMGALSVSDRLSRLEAKVDELLARGLEAELAEDDPPAAPRVAGSVRAGRASRRSR